MGPGLMGAFDAIEDHTEVVKERESHQQEEEMVAPGGVMG